MPASFVTSSRIPAQNAATIFKPLAHSPHSTPFTCGAKINLKKKQIVFLVRKLDIQSIISMIMFTRSSERILMQAAILVHKYIYACILRTRITHISWQQPSVHTCY